MRRKTFLIYLLSFLLVAFVPTLTSCKKDKETETPVPNPEEKDPEEKDDEEIDDEKDFLNIEYLQGTNYYVVYLDATAEEKIKEKIVADLRPDDVNRFFYIWENTYSTATPTGINYFGKPESWMTLVVQQAGWSGAGFNINKNESYDFSDIDDDYVFHMAVKSQDDAVHTLAFDGKNKTKAEFVIGNRANSDGLAADKNFPRDGKWHTLEIPMGDLFDKGLAYGSKISDINMLSILSGNNSGARIEFDAVFIYLPKK